jgi:hypothetical protein
MERKNMIESADNSMKHIEQSRMPLILNAVSALENIQQGQSGPLLLTFWGSKGMGKTTLLNNIAYRLRNHHPEIAINVLDIREYSQEQIEETFHKEISNIQHEKILVILLDNLDELLRSPQNGQAFFDFERNSLLPIIERGKTLIIASSQIELNQWREDDVRVRQVTHQIPALNIEEVTAIVNSTGLKAREVYDLTFGQPRVAGWLLENPLMSAKEIADQASVYFLEDIPAKARQIARVICLLPIFNAYLLQKILNRDNSKNEIQYLECLEWLKEYIRRGLVYWDVSIGSYRFTDSAVRRLLARHVRDNDPSFFKRIQKIALEYFQGESRSAGYLYMHLVSAVYHLIQTSYDQPSGEIGDECLKWIRDELKSWRGASWKEVLLAWENGAGEQAVKEEIIHTIGIEYFDLITQEIKTTMQVPEVQNDKPIISMD